MKADLLPLSLADVFDESFDLYKTNFALFAGIVAVVHVPTQILVQALSFTFGMDQLAGRIASASGNPNDLLPAAFGIMAYGIVLSLLYTFVFVVQNGALTVAVSERYLGRPITLGSAYRRTLGFLPRLLGTWALVFGVLFAVLFGVFWVVAVLAGVLMAAGGGGGREAVSDAVAVVLAILVMAPCTVAALVVFVRMGSFVTQIVIVEGMSYGAALQRNAQLLRGRFWRLLGAVALLLMILGVLLITLVSSLGFVTETMILPFFEVPTMLRSAVSQVWLAIIWMLLQPFWMVCLTLFYYDQRVRREGFDLSLLERQVRAAPGAPA